MVLFRRILAFGVLSAVKIFSHLFYKNDLRWSPEYTKDYFKNVRMIAFMNHTSLYEPLFSCALPFSFLWKIAGHSNVPGANITLDRPLVGFIWKIMLPKITSITRQRDESWKLYLDSIEEDDVIMIAPEGYMKRPNGLNKYGKKMTVRGGIVEILDKMDHGHVILAMSGGLHHVQAPGQKFPKLFKRISMNVVRLDIKEYKAQFQGSAREIYLAMVGDLQRRLESDCPISSPLP